METFQSKTPYSRVYSGMRWMDVTTTLAPAARPAFELANPAFQTLAAKHAAQEQLLEQLQTARIHVMFYEMNAETAIRNVYAGLRILDHGQIGDFCRRIMPNGLSAEIKPASQDQVTEIAGILSRARAAGLPDNSTLAPLLKELETSNDRLQTAVTERAAALAAVDDARNQYNQAKSEFLLAYARAAAHIKVLYPRDKDQQDFFFEKFDPRQHDTQEPAAPPEPKPGA